MSKPKDILSQLQTQLQNDTTLKAYVKQVLIGTRESVTLFPSVFLEPRTEDESPDTYGKENIMLEVTVVGVVCVADKDKQVLGDTIEKGIMDLKNDICLAIDQDPTLSGKAVHTWITQTRYNKGEYPARWVETDLRILYKQDVKART